MYCIRGSEFKTVLIGRGHFQPTLPWSRYRHYTVVHDASAHFDTNLPLHATAGGVLIGPEDGRVSSLVEMWLDAPDFLFGTHSGVDLCPGLESSSTPTFMFTISNMAQSFGLAAELLLSGLNPSQSLASQLFPSAFCLHNSPTWQDSLSCW